MFMTHICDRKTEFQRICNKHLGFLTKIILWLYII